MADGLNSTLLPVPPIVAVLLGLPRSDVEVAVEALIAHLDAIDGDPDLEPEVDCCDGHDDIGTASGLSRLLANDFCPGSDEDAEQDNEDCCPAGDDCGVPRGYRPPVQILARHDLSGGNGQRVYRLRDGKVLVL
ncbi:hypothetical protein [Niveispirillum sp.]|uniref:hypothetical protein n=1 Tax=Niveispirillum sp. TaxID=1917217 RepID=UPI001B5E9216|nr:hypothetical protein [Niveispirillum sp.]MBP7339088.1 hypothetical protein [Niveispirillum sp.]